MPLSTITRPSLSISAVASSNNNNINNLVDTEINTDISLDAFDFSVQIDNVTLEKNAIQSHIEKEDINIKNYTLDYVGSVSNSYIKDIDNNVIRGAKEYKINFYKKYYQKLDIDLDLFLKKSNNLESIDNFIVNKIFENDKIFNSLNDGVTSLFANYKSFSLFEEIKNVVTKNNYSSRLMGQVTQRLIYNISKDTKDTKNNPRFSFPQSKSIIFENKILNENAIKERLLFNIIEEKFNFNTSNKSNSTNIIIQNFVSIARSLYTVYPNSLDTFISEENKTTYRESINNFSDKIVTNEYVNCDFYKHINEDEGYFNSDLFLRENTDLATSFSNSLQINNFLLSNYLGESNINPSFSDDYYYSENIATRILNLRRSGSNNNFIFLAERTFGNEALPGQIYYPRSFIQYLTRHIFGDHKAREKIFDIFSDNSQPNIRLHFEKYKAGRDFNLKGLIEIAANNAYEADFTGNLINPFLKRNFLNTSANTLKSSENNFKTITEFIIAARRNVNQNESLIEGYRSIRIANHLYRNKNTKNTDYADYIRPTSSPVYVDHIPTFYFDFKKNSFNVSTSASIDNKNFIINILRDPVQTSLNIDSIVKKLKHKKVKTKVFKELITKIKNNINSNIHLPYTDNDKDNISIIDENSKIFDLLFVKKDEDIYSNIDIFLNKKINSKKFKSLLESKALNIFKKVDIDEIKDFINSYYVKSTFDSSSTFYLNIIKSIVKESKIFDSISESSQTISVKKMQDYSILQALYFNFIYYNKNSEVIDTISRRFIKHAILESNFSLSNLVSKEFKYDFRKYARSDYDITSEEEVRNYIKDVLSTSESLEKIRKSVFQNNNVKKLVKNNCGYSTINDLDLSGALFFVENRLIFPFTFLAKLYKITEGSGSKKVKDITEISCSSITKNSILKNTLRENDAIINPYTNRNIEYDRSDNADNSYYTLSNDGFNSTLSDKINLNVRFKSLNFRNNFMTNDITSSYSLTDNFENICKNESFVFYNIVLLIKDILENFTDISLCKEEKDIDDFINSAKDIVNIVKEILYTVSEIYLIYFARLQRNLALNNFSWINNEEDNNIDNLLNRENFEANITEENNNEIFYDLSDSSLKLRNISPGANVFQDSLISKINSSEIVDDLNVLVSNINDNLESFYNSNKITKESKNKESEWKSEVTEVLYNIFSTLITSDVYQATSIDFIGLLINYLEKINNISYQDMSDNGLLNELSFLLGSDNIDTIKQKIYNPVFINTLALKNMSLMEKNIALYDNLDILNNSNANSMQKYDNANLFSYLSEKKEKNINKIKESLPESEGDILHLSDVSNFWNSDFHTFNLQISNLFNLEISNLISITVNLIDHENLNRVYLPKTFVFTPLLTCNHFNVTNLLVFFNPFSENLFDRVLSADISDLNGKFFTKIIEKKKPILCEDNPVFSLNLFKHILRCHLTSGQINLINEHVNGVKLDYLKNGNFETTQEIIDLMTDLDDLTFFNTFNIEKKDAELLLSKNDQQEYNLPSILKSFKMGTTFFENAKALNDMLGNKELTNINNTIYDSYSINVNPKDFIFFELYNAGENIPVNAVPYVISQSDISLLEMTNFDRNIIINKTLYSGIDIKNDNYSIEISYKVI